MSINIALIGSGIFAREQHLPAILSSPHFSLRAIYSRSHNSAVSLLSSLPSSSHADIELYCSDSDPSRTYASLLRRPDIHAVSIALPITTQSEFIAAALRAGKHVLSEKPMGPDVETARKLLACLTEARLHKNIDSNTETNVSNDVSASSNIIWAVGENVRFLPSFHYAREQIEKLGEVTGFRTQVLRNTRAGERMYETPWRKNPSHQGGFLLDGGVHYVAGTRLLLGPSNIPKCLSAFTSQLQTHLPPLDTVCSIWSTHSNVSGTFSVSFGTMLSAYAYSISCARGSVTIAMGLDGVYEVTVREGEEKNGVGSVRRFEGEGLGVKEEIDAWAKSIIRGDGVVDARQSPEEGLRDLEILEKMILSGANGGKTYNLDP